MLKMKLKMLKLSLSPMWEENSFYLKKKKDYDGCYIELNFIEIWDFCGRYMASKNCVITTCAYVSIENIQCGWTCCELWGFHGCDVSSRGL
jgi:hypothetical protein